MPHLRTAATLLLCASMASLSTGAWARDTASDTTAAVLETLNQEYRALYREGTQQVLDSLPLVLVVQNHTITAVRGEQRKLYPVPLQRYNEARAVVHAALGFQGLMAGQIRRQESGQDAEWARVDAFVTRLGMTRQAAAKSTLTRTEKQYAAQLIDILEQGTREARTVGRVSHQTTVNTLRQAQPVLLALSESVGKAHAQSLLAVLESIKSSATEDEWAKAIAVVTGPVTARRNNLETAATASSLGVDKLGSRIFYSENIFDVDGALAYLRTLVGDQALSEDAFGRPERMWEDLFAPVSRELINTDFYTELK